MSKHYVTVEDGQVTKFVCEDDHGPCHTYPGCECEEWGPLHEEEFGTAPHGMVHHEDCWMQGWFDNPESTSYNGEDGFDGEVPLDLTQSGYIETEWDDCVIWKFIEEET